MAEEKKTTAKKPAAKKTTTTATKKAPAKKVEAPKAEEVKVAEAPKAEEKPAKASKKEATKVEEKKPEAPKKVVTSARAIAYDVRVTPRKARLVLDLIRNKGVNEALGILANVNKAASPIVAKVVRSAAANAMNNFGMKEEFLYVAECYANDGIKMKRFLPRAKGSASGLVKRTSHITVVVKER